MHPQLLYLYVDDIGRCYEQQEFCFTNDYHITYDRNSKELLIEPKKNPYVNLWGTNISNINLIVGKNGAGKTTILDLLGSTKYRRDQLFRGAKWFSIYHIEDNQFVAEGNAPELLSNIKDALYLDLDYSFCFLYDFEHKTARFKNYIQHEFYNLEGKRYSIDRALVSLYQPRQIERYWLTLDNTYNVDDTTVSFQRTYLQKPTLASVYLFMTKEYSLLENIFTIDQAVCEMEGLKNIFPSFTSQEEKQNLLGFQLYQGKEEIILFDSDRIISYRKNENQPEKFSTKEKFIISYLEAIIIDLWINSSKELLNNNEKKTCIKQVNDCNLTSNNYIDRIEYLFMVLDIISNIVSPLILENDGVNYSPQPFRALVIALEQLSFDYFVTKSKIQVPIHNGFDKDLYELLVMYDRFTNSRGVIRSLQVMFKHLSSGELEFINGFACLHSALQVALNHNEVSTILLLLDEPDAAFHPEWSRRYIYYLQEYLKTVEFNRDVRYQVLISTHSPFIVSDVPREHITCIDVINVDGKLQRVVKKADFGLMSNFYDIVKKDFFLASPMGEFAKQLFNQILKRINEWKEYDIEEIEHVSGQISAIGEKVIRRKLQEHLEVKARSLSLQLERARRIRELERELEALRAQEENEL